MKRIVIKIGSSSLVKRGKLDEARLDSLIKEIKMLRDNDIKSCIVTSGSIALGAYSIGVKPKDIKMKQACAAHGQAILMEGYMNASLRYGMKCAQILVNHDDFENRERMLNLENTLNTLLDNDIIPIINENDALAVEEIKVGDNDTLSALIAPMASADMLVLLSDIDGLFTDNPKTNKDAVLIKRVDKITDDIKAMAHPSSTEVGTGGMETKINAAIIATTSGVDMIIQNANSLEELHKAFSDDYSGTLFVRNKSLNARNQWILFKTRPTGSIIVDEGCIKAILNRKSLLASGIIGVSGFIMDGDVVNISYDGKVYAKGISNFSNYDILKIKGHSSNEIESILGHKAKNEVIHANDIALLEE